MSTKQLPSRPSLNHLKHQAKDLLKAHRAGKLSEAQLIIAREYGFESWPKLKKHVESLAQGVDPSVNAFIEAAVAGNQSEAKKILAGNPSLSRANIYTAAILGEASVVETMLKHDAKLATRRGGPKNWDALLYASFSRFHRERSEGIVRTAKLLLAHGADPNTSYPWEQDVKNALPALWAATSESNHPALARVLLEAGANPNDSESVYHAAQNYHVGCLELLQEFGANFSGPFQPWNNTPLYFLLGHKPGSGPAERVFNGIRWLLEHGADPNAPSYDFAGRPVHLAASNGWGVELFELLLKHGADLKARRKDGASAYALAVRHGHQHAADWLRQHGAQTELSPTDEFFAACGRGNESAVRAIMAERPDFARSVGDDDKRLMLDAAWDGNTEAVRLMLLAGIPVDFRGADDTTALHFASLSGHSQTVRMLLTHNPPLEIKDKNHHATPLGWATWGSQNDMNPNGDYPATVEALLAAGAATWEGISGSDAVNKVLPRLVFWQALVRGDIERAKQLLAGTPNLAAEVNRRDDRGKTPFFWAIIHRNFSMAEFLLAIGANVNDRWGDGWSLLHHEAKDGKAATVEFLLKHGADPNIRDHRVQPGSTPLHGAARQDRLNVAKLLIQYGADVNAKTDLGQTVLDAARSSKKQKVVELLLGKTKSTKLADLSRQIREFWSAMNRSDIPKLKKLIAAGIDVNQPWPLQEGSVHVNLFSPLLSAASTGKVAVAKVLLDHGADVHGGNRWMTPILWAASRRHEEMVKLLRQHGAKETIFVAAALGHADRVSADLRKDSKLITQRDERGQTLLHWAAYALRRKVVALLLERGADVNSVDELDSTPLHLACDVRLADPMEQQAVLQLLIAAGANVNAAANHNITPLHRAARARNPVAVKLLLEHGAEGDARDDRGSTPLRRAVSQSGAGGTAGSREEAIAIIRLLIQAGANPMLKNKEGKTVLASARDAEFRRLLNT